MASKKRRKIFKYSGILYFVFIVSEVSKKHSAIIFREKQLNLDCSSIKVKVVIIRNIENCLPEDTKHVFSNIPLKTSGMSDLGRICTIYFRWTSILLSAKG